MRQSNVGLSFRVAELEAQMRQSNVGLSFRVAELEAHVSEMEAVKANMRGMFNTLASAHLTNPGSQLHADSRRGIFTWVITDWSKIRTPVHRSEPFTIGGFKWRLLVFPKGDKPRCGRFLSVFLEVADPEVQPKGWTRKAAFSFAVQNQIDKKYNITLRGYLWRLCCFSRKFRESYPAWGLPEVVKLSKINDASKGYIVDDTLIVECKVIVRK